MKRKLCILITVLIGLTGIGSAVRAGVFVEVGDRPFYVHGAGYWAGGAHYFWVPGHWGPHHHVWVHGHYARR